MFTIYQFYHLSDLAALSRSLVYHLPPKSVSGLVGFNAFAILPNIYQFTILARLTASAFTIRIEFPALSS